MGRDRKTLLLTSILGIFLCAALSVHAADLATTAEDALYASATLQENTYTCGGNTPCDAIFTLDASSPKTLGTDITITFEDAKQAPLSAIPFTYDYDIGTMQPVEHTTFVPGNCTDIVLENGTNSTSCDLMPVTTTRNEIVYHGKSLSKGTNYLHLWSNDKPADLTVDWQITIASVPVKAGSTETTATFDTHKKNWALWGGSPNGNINRTNGDAGTRESKWSYLNDTTLIPAYNITNGSITSAGSINSWTRGGEYFEGKIYEAQYSGTGGTCNVTAHNDDAGKSVNNSVYIAGISAECSSIAFWDAKNGTKYVYTMQYQNGYALKKWLYNGPGISPTLISVTNESICRYDLTVATPGGDNLGGSDAKLIINSCFSGTGVTEFLVVKNLPSLSINVSSIAIPGCQNNGAGAWIGYDHNLWASCGGDTSKVWVFNITDASPANWKNIVNYTTALGTMCNQAQPYFTSTQDRGRLLCMDWNSGTTIRERNYTRDWSVSLFKALIPTNITVSSVSLNWTGQGVSTVKFSLDNGQHNYTAINNTFVGANEQGPNVTIYVTWNSTGLPYITQFYLQAQSTEMMNETGGRQAILDGIQGSAISGTYTVAYDRQVAIRLANGSQYSGRFDLFVTSGSKRWAFNYDQNSTGSFPAFTNITPVFWVWQKANLTAPSITSDVSTLINSTA